MKTFFAFILMASAIFAAVPPASGEITIDGHIDMKLHMDKVIDSAEATGEVLEGYTDSHIYTILHLPWGFSLETEVLLEGEPCGHDHGHGEEEEEEEHAHEAVCRTAVEEHEEEAAEPHSHADPPAAAQAQEEEEEVELRKLSFFGDHVFTLQTFMLKYTRAFGPVKWSLYGGKFVPVVGIDAESLPGVYSYRALHEYDLDPKIGLGTKFVVNAEDFGTHQLNTSLFTADTTAFSDNGSGDRLKRADGGPSNNGDLTSVVFSLGGKNFYTLRDGFFANFLEGFSYRIGYANQKKQSMAYEGEYDEHIGPPTTGDETRYTFSMGQKRNFTENLSLTLKTEYININNYGGETGRLRNAWTVATAFDWKRWTLAGSYSSTDNRSSTFTRRRIAIETQVRDRTPRENVLPPEEDTGSLGATIYSFSLSRKLGGGGAKLGVGYQSVKEEGETTGRIGMLLSYSGSFFSGSAESHEGHDH